ncbi:hypothetical protein KC315_g16625 [Hortaea werneckii]|nr:hypothetical protein KC315_g16625 [Hortaea werneckii]KAI7336258.1 hypothetical protein KC354_g17772 [Hortaea werneckii]KAI7531210.1 hypothetical protein KC331_g14242 [Hortaea werneckii]KAI7704090.1 hypothetical protein KC353_g13706 [Hortaea werneckii]
MARLIEPTNQPRRIPSLFTIHHGQTSTARFLGTKYTSQQRGQHTETKIICRSQPEDALSKGADSPSSGASISISFEIALYDKKPSTSPKAKNLGRISCSLPWKAAFDGSYHAFSAKLKQEMLSRVEVQGSLQMQVTDVLLTCPPTLREAVVKPESWAEIVNQLSQIAQGPRRFGDVSLRVLVACTFTSPAPKLPTPVCRYFGGAKTGVSDDEASDTDEEEEEMEQPVSQEEGTEILDGLLTPSTPTAQQGLKRKRLTLAAAAEYADSVLPTTEQGPCAPGWAYRLIPDPPAWERNLANRTHSPTDDLLGIHRHGKCRRIQIPVSLPESA